GEIEELASNSKAVHERGTASRGMSFVFEGPGFQHRCSEESYIGDFATHTIDLNPIADMHSVPADKDEPAKEREEKVLQSYRETSRDKTQNGWRLFRRAKDDEQNEHYTDYLIGQDEDAAQGLSLPAIERWARHQLPHQRIANDHADQDEN